LGQEEGGGQPRQGGAILGRAGPQKGHPTCTAMRTPGVK